MSYTTGLKYWFEDNLQQIKCYFGDFTMWLFRPWADIHEENWQIVGTELKLRDLPASCSRRRGQDAEEE